MSGGIWVQGVVSGEQTAPGKNNSVPPASKPKLRLRSACRQLPSIFDVSGRSSQVKAVDDGVETGGAKGVNDTPFLCEFLGCRACWMCIVATSISSPRLESFVHRIYGKACASTTWEMRV